MDKKRDVQKIIADTFVEAALVAQVAVQNLTFKVFKQYITEQWDGNPLYEDVLYSVKKMSALRFNRLRDSVASWKVEQDDVTQEDLGIISRQARKTHRDEARELAAKTDFMQAIGLLMDAHKFKVPDFNPPFKKSPTNRIVNLHLSDLHLGADLRPEQNLIRFNWVEESRRLASVFAQTCAYKRDHRKESILHVYLNGDIIQGMLGHDPRDGHPITKQYMGALHVLTQGLYYAAKQFKQVEVFCQPGNHGRIKDRHESRATIDKWDAYETMLYGAIQMRFSDVENVQFHQDETPWGEFEAFGRHGCYTHGDTVVPAGNPSKTLNISGIESFIDRTNAGRAAKGQPVFELLTIGHTHVPLCMLFDNGCWFINNGSLIPSDGFAASIGRIHKMHNTQALWESTPDHIVGDYRLLKVGPYTDVDSSLDKLIKPYDGGLILPKVL